MKAKQEEETSLNIWKSYNFNEKSGKSAYEYLNEQKSGLIAKTKGFLTMDVECYNNTENQFICRLYIVAPHLGNYRREILQVAEDGVKRFPVEVRNHLSDETIKNVSEKKFLDVVGEIILSPLVKRSIEGLYQQSKENAKT